MSKELIAETQLGASIDNISVLGDNIPCTFIASGLTGTEQCVVQIQTADGTYIDVYSEDKQIVLTPTNNVVTIIAPGEYKLVLSTTANNAAVYMTSERFK